MFTASTRDEIVAQTLLTRRKRQQRINKEKTTATGGSVRHPELCSFSTALHKKNLPFCDEQPLLRISASASSLHAHGFSQSAPDDRSSHGLQFETKSLLL